MTIVELIDFLNDYPDKSMKVMLAIDSEGNGFSLLSACGDNLEGDVYGLDIDEDEAVILLWPV